MEKNTNAIKIFSIFFVLILSAVSASALSLVTEFDNGAAEKSIMPGQSTEYYVIGVADQGLSKMHVSGQLYDVTTGEKILLADLFDMETINTFFYPDAFSITSSDYDNLPGTYLISVTAEEWLTNGIYRAKTSDLKLEVIGNRLPVAEFDYSPSNPTTITPVTFDSSSYDTDGYIVKEEWFSNSVKIGEGNVLTYTFTKPGTYTIMLKVTDNEGGTDTTTKTVVVTQGAQTIYPVADFTYSPLNPKTNEVVTFTSTSYDSDGSIVKEEWDFNNNGAFETLGHVATKTFTQPGSYTVYLKVTDNSNLEASTSKIVVVVDPVPANVPPVADFTYVPVNITAGQVVTFTSTSYDVDGSIVKEEWDLNNDGEFTWTGHVVSKNFTQPGTYVVSLRVTDDDGTQDVESKTVVVNKFVPVNVVPVANFSYSPLDLSVCGVMVFTSTSYDVDGSIIKEEWDLNNDGVFEVSGHSVSKNFTQSGVYVITLKVTDNSGAVDVEKKTLTINCQTPVNIPPVANFTYIPKNPLVNQAINFTSNSYDVDGSIVKEEWDLNNDGVFEISGHLVSKAFSKQGNYTVTLRVTDDDGAQDTEKKTIVVVNPVPVNVPPVANFTYVPKNITEGDNVAFTSTSYDPDGYIVAYEWLVDGIYVSSGPTMNTSFTVSGIHSVKLTVTDNLGAKDSETKQIFVYCKPNVLPVADFTYNPSNPKAKEQVTFTSTSYDPDGHIVSYEWFVNGKNVSGAQVMQYVFAQPGNYTITLKVKDNDGASASVSKVISISKEDVCPPNAVLRMPESVTMNTLVKMDGSLSTPGCNATITSYKWQVFKKGTLLSELVTTTPYSDYTFTSNAEYKVVLTVYNSNGLSDTDEKTVFAGRPKTGIVVGGEDDLYVDYFDVIGSEYGVIECTQSFAITATVSNDRDEDIEDLRVTFAIPELGYKIKSAAFDLDAGKTKTVTFYGDLDMMKEDIVPGEYYAFIGASDTDTIRVKYFPLIIK